MAILTATAQGMINGLKRYTNRQDLTQGYDTDTGASLFFNLAKRRMDDKLRLREMLTSTTLTGSDHPFTLPDDYLEVKEVINTGAATPYGLQRSDRIEVTRLQTTDSGSKVRKFETTGTTLSMGPAPAATDTFELTYYARPDEWDATGDNDIYTNKYPHVLLAGALAEYYWAVQEPESGAFWDQRFNDYMEQLIIKEGKELYSGYPVAQRNA